MSGPRDRLARALGILPGYRDATGAQHAMTGATRDALLAGFGVRSDGDVDDRLATLDRPRAVPLWQVVAAGTALHLPHLDGAGWSIALEEGSHRCGQGGAIDPLPVGIHAITVGADTGWLLAAPATLPEPPLSWGVTLPLYGLSRDGRIGTYADLAEAAKALGRAGADFIGINPVHAGFLHDARAFSPYAPSHRGWLSALHVFADEPPLPGDDLLDYETATASRIAALRADAAPDPAFDRWRAEAGAELERFALHQALSSHYGSYWTGWPDALHDPEGYAARGFAIEHADEVTFHAWLQWRAEMQIAKAQDAALDAGMRFGLYLDLAVGTHPQGAETWGQPELFANGVSLGAPPDAFSADGQSWGLAPLRPDTLADAGFRPLQAILRRALAHARLLRIDHVLGFERAFWAPDEDIPGGYVAMPRAALMAVARIEAVRVGATIVGEDLGNIPDGLRGAMEDSGLLGCRVTQFEREWDDPGQPFVPARGYARAALTSWGSHDLPTWQGWRQGRDIDWRREVGDIDAPEHAAAMSERAEAVLTLDALLGGTSVADLHTFLAGTPSRLVVVQIEDLLGRVEQANLPGTVHRHPNWRRRIGVAPDALGDLDAVAATATIMGQAGR